MLAATDPAQPYGAALRWPERAEGDDAPARSASRAPTSSSSAPSRCSTSSAAGAACWCSADAGDPRVRPALDALAAFVTSGRAKLKLAVERVDGEPVVGSPWEPLLDRGRLPPGPAQADAERLGPCSRPDSPARRAELRPSRRVQRGDVADEARRHAVMLSRLRTRSRRHAVLAGRVTRREPRGLAPSRAPSPASAGPRIASDRRGLDTTSACSRADPRAKRVPARSAAVGALSCATPNAGDRAAPYTTERRRRRRHPRACTLVRRCPSPPSVHAAVDPTPGIRSTWHHVDEQVGSVVGLQVGQRQPPAATGQVDDRRRPRRLVRHPGERSAGPLHVHRGLRGGTRGTGGAGAGTSLALTPVTTVSLTLSSRMVVQ